MEELTLYAANRRGYPIAAPWQLLAENPFPDHSHGYLSCGRGDFSAQNLGDFILNQYPDGLSPHGWSYMTLRYGAPRLTNGENILPNEPIMELIFETVRQAHYELLPSRLQSYFAYATLEEAQAFAPDSMMISVRTNSYFKADQTWLNVSYQVAVAYYNAHQYWQGQPSSTPVWEYLVTPPISATHINPLS